MQIIQRTGTDRMEHDNMVKRVADHLRNQGHKVSADILGYERPAQIGAHIPDVSSVDSTGTRHIVEVETCETINIQHTADQWRTFGHSGANFYIAVPRVCELSAKSRATQLGLNPIVWGI